jgi:hypothetical protein
VTDQPGLDRLAWRYVTGGRLDGLPIQPGAPWPRRRRALWRLGPPTMLVAAAVEYSTHPAATEASLSVLTTAAAVRGAQAARRAWRTRRFRAVYIRPTLAALRPALGDAPVRLHVDPGLGTLMTRLAKPMSPAEEAVRAWYGARMEPVLRWAPDHVQRAAWAVQRAARPVTRHAAHAAPPGRPRPAHPARHRGALPDRRAAAAGLLGDRGEIPAGELVETWDQVGPAVRATWTVRRRPPTMRVRRPGRPVRPAGRSGSSSSAWGRGPQGRHQTCATTPLTSPARPATGAGKSVFCPAHRRAGPGRGGQVDHPRPQGQPPVGARHARGHLLHHPRADARRMIRAAVQADRRNAESLHQPEDWNPGLPAPRRGRGAERDDAAAQGLVGGDQGQG